MKEVVAHQRYGGSLEDAIDGSILFISNLLKIDERELRSYLREQSKTNDVAP
jgi:hypothetical protein